MKYPKYGTWCKQNVLETIRKQKINESKKCLEDLVFNSGSDLYSTGVYDYDVSDILWIINGDPDIPVKSLFLAVQHSFDEKYFQMMQKINPQMDMKKIRIDGGECSKLLYATLEDIAIDELKKAVMYALNHGTEEVEEPKIPYIKTQIGDIVKAIKSNLIEIEDARINYLDPNAEIKVIPVDKVEEYLMHLGQSGIFANTINWRLVDLFDSGCYLLEGDIGHNNGYELAIVVTANGIENKDKIIEIMRESEE